MDSTQNHSKIYKKKQRKRKRERRLDIVVPLIEESRRREYPRKRESETIFDGGIPLHTFPGEEYKDWKFINKDTCIVTDRTTNEVTFIAHFTTFEELREDKQAYDDLQSVFHFLFHAHSQQNYIKLNSVHKNAGSLSTCTGYGYRMGYDHGFTFGRYCCKTSITQDSKKLDEWYHAQKYELQKVEQVYKQRFTNLSPLLCNTMIKTANETGVPSFGQSDINSITEPFASSLFVSKNYASAEHKDDDYNPWVFGIFAPVFEQSGSFASFNDGYSGTASLFGVILYRIAVEMNKHDGIIEMIWQGNHDAHMTTPGTVKEGFARIGTSIQINNKLVAACAKYHADSGLKVRDLPTYFTSVKDKSKKR
jgi:hypothetical protein